MFKQEDLRDGPVDRVCAAQAWELDLRSPAPGKTGYGGNLSTGGMEAGEAGIQFLTLG